MDRFIYVLRFRDNVIDEITFKRYTRITDAHRAIKTMKKDNNIELLDLTKYNYDKHSGVVVENYGK